MDTLMVLMMEILGGYCFETYWDILMVNFLALMKS